jgi:hypothetical protein
MSYVHPPKFLLEVQDLFSTVRFCIPFIFLYGEEAKSWGNHIYSIKRELYVFQLVALLHRRKGEKHEQGHKKKSPEGRIQATSLIVARIYSPTLSRDAGLNVRDVQKI